ncbi:Exonuclease domain-containing protein [Psidium guajava]|nr:Exonuclease domain-containing protein [Psidium guajava]
MAHCHHHPLVLFCSLWVFLPSILAQTVQFKLPLKAVNLGNWLVTEGWMMPSRFDGLNGQLLDGTQVQFKSTRLRKFLSAENGGGATIVANRDQASAGNFRVKSPTEVTADYNGGTSWDDNDPSVFEMNAFGATRKYGMKVIVDLHAAPGSQNGDSHSASRDGYVEWGYGNHPALVAIELMNEPLAPDVKFEVLIKYYQLGYEAVRRHTPNAYVILSNRLGPVDPQELLQFARGLSRAVIDVHYYNLFELKFKQWNLKQNIDYIYNDRASNLSKVTLAKGPLSFVGEWTSALDFKGATKADSGTFAKAQQDVYGRANFGWAYWSYKCQYDTWNFKQMTEDGFIHI